MLHITSVSCTRVATMWMLYVHCAATKFVGVDCALLLRVISTLISKRYSLRFGLGPCTPTFFGEVLLKTIMHYVRLKVAMWQRKYSTIWTLYVTCAILTFAMMRQ